MSDTPAAPATEQPELTHIHAGMTLHDIAARLAEEHVTMFQMRVGVSDVWIFNGVQGRRLSNAAAGAIAKEKP